MNDGANTMCSLFLYFLLFSWLISPLRAKEMTHVAAISQWVVACRCNQHVRWVLIVAASYSCTAKANIGYFFVIPVTLLLTLHIFLIRECLFVSTHRNNTTTTITQYRRTYPFTDRWSTYNYHFCPFLHFIPFPFASSSLLLYFFFFSLLLSFISQQQQKQQQQQQKQQHRQHTLHNFKIRHNWKDHRGIISCYIAECVALFAVVSDLDAANPVHCVHSGLRRDSVNELHNSTMRI